MSFHELFKLRENVTDGILDLLNSTVLGTNGAQYKHLDTSERVHQADEPLFLSLERKEKVLGNITFCRRGKDWYIRYFAFSQFLQAGKSKQSVSKGNSRLKNEIENFFNEIFEGKHSSKPIDSLYAYIDPKNDRSKWMSENFGFTTVAELATQSFSRHTPRQSKRLEKLENWDEIKDNVRRHFSQMNYYFEAQIQKAPYYLIRDEKGEILAYTRITKVNWEIVRFPGKMGGFLTKAIPFIPILNKLIRPKNHTFLVPDIVYIKNEDPLLLDELFSGVLYQEGLNLILWWIDIKDPLYQNVKNQMSWGLLHKLIGVPPVDVVVKAKEKSFTAQAQFVCAFDMV